MPLPLLIGTGRGLRRARTNVETGEFQDPTDVANLEAWFRADAEVYSDTAMTSAAANGGPVQAWKDQSGHGRHVTWPEGEMVFEPQFVANAQNGLPAIDFGQMSSPLSNTTANLVAAGGARTVFVVAVDDTGFGGGLMAFRVSVEYQSPSFLETDFGSSRFVNGDGTNAAANVKISDPGGLSSYFYSVHKYNGTGNDPAIRVNGIDRPLTNAGSTNQTTEDGPDGFMIGGNPAGQTWQGKIGEVVVYSRALTSDEIGDVEGYLVGRWGILGP